MRYLILLAILLVPLAAHAYCMDDDYECWDRVQALALERATATADAAVPATIARSAIAWNSGCDRYHCYVHASWCDYDDSTGGVTCGAYWPMIATVCDTWGCSCEYYPAGQTFPINC